MNNKCYISLYKSGTFFNAYGDDAVILHLLLGYKYLSIKKSAGFPANALPKVKSVLEYENIAYKIYNKEELIEEGKGIDKKYSESIKKGLKKLEIEERMDRLNKKLDKLTVSELEKVLEGLEDAKQ